MRSKAALAVLALLVIPTAANAFSAAGHKLIAKLAYERLNPTAKADVDALLAISDKQGTPQCPANTIEQASVWADCVRDAKISTYRELTHHEEIPMCGIPNPARYCRDGRCVGAQAEQAIDTLKNSSGNTQDRLEALEIVIHFIGDAHQPLHTIGAYGHSGVSISVNYPGEEGRDRSLHQIWDKELVNAALDQGGEGAVKALMNQNAAQWASGTPEDWVQESHDIGVRYGYRPLGLDGCGKVSPQGVQITQSYIDQAAPVEREQLAKAAVRLADVLNASLH